MNGQVAKKIELRNTIEDISDAIANLHDIELIDSFSIRKLYKGEYLDSNFHYIDFENVEKFIESYFKLFTNYPTVWRWKNLSELNFEIAIEFKSILYKNIDLAPFLKEINHSYDLIKSLNYDVKIISIFTNIGSLNIKVII